MELLAIVLLGISALVSFSTSDRQKAKTNQPENQDADLQFTEAYELDGSPSKK